MISVTWFSQYYRLRGLHWKASGFKIHPWPELVAATGSVVANYDLWSSGVFVACASPSLTCGCVQNDNGNKRRVKWQITCRCASLSLCGTDTDKESTWRTAHFSWNSAKNSRKDFDRVRRLWHPLFHLSSSPALTWKTYFSMHIRCARSGSLPSKFKVEVSHNHTLFV